MTADSASRATIRAFDGRIEPPDRDEQSSFDYLAEIGREGGSGGKADRAEPPPDPAEESRRNRALSGPMAETCGMGDDATRAASEYDAMAHAYADDTRTHPLNSAYERPAMLAMAGEVRGKRVLDVGCAAGALSALLLERGAEVVGIDVSERMVDIARRDLGGRAAFHVADVGRPMPFLADESFDLVTASLVLHYLRDWTVPLREFHRVLRPDGALLISTHHPTQDVAIVDSPAPYFDVTLLTDTWHKGGRDFRVSFYHRPLSAIVDALAEAGFVIERIPEPRPDDPAAFAGIPGLFERVSRDPWFLFIRAVKRTSASAAPASA